MTWPLFILYLYQMHYLMTDVLVPQNPFIFLFPLSSPSCFMKRLNSVGLKNTGCAEITHCRAVQLCLKLLFRTGSL
jgi:hypothetical protein